MYVFYYFKIQISATLFSSRAGITIEMYLREEHESYHMQSILL